MWASSQGNGGIAQLLISNKADVNQQRRSGSTALMRAAEKGHIDIAKVLIDNKADPKLVNSRGKRASDFAKENKHAEVFGLLDPEGAKVASW